MLIHQWDFCCVINTNSPKKTSEALETGFPANIGEVDTPRKGQNSNQF